MRAGPVGGLLLLASFASCVVPRAQEAVAVAVVVREDLGWTGPVSELVERARPQLERCGAELTSSTDERAKLRVSADGKHAVLVLRRDATGITLRATADDGASTAWHRTRECTKSLREVVTEAPRPIESADGGAVVPEPSPPTTDAGPPAPNPPGEPP